MRLSTAWRKLAAHFDAASERAAQPGESSYAHFPDGAFLCNHVSHAGIPAEYIEPMRTRIAEDLAVRAELLETDDEGDHDFAETYGDDENNPARVLTCLMFAEEARSAGL